MCDIKKEEEDASIASYNITDGYSMGVMLKYGLGRWLLSEDEVIIKHRIALH